jgi:hypothetical protein
MTPRMLPDSANRRSSIGGSDARIIMGDDEAALEKSGRGRAGISTGTGTKRTSGKPGNGVGIQSYPQRVRLPGLRRRTPCPPPFSSMKSTPPDLIAPTIRSAVSPRPPRGPSKASSRLMVGIDTSAAFARSSCDQPSSARAALTWRIDTFSIDFWFMLFDTFSIDILPNRRRVGSQ